MGKLALREVSRCLDLEQEDWYSIRGPRDDDMIQISMRSEDATSRGSSPE